MWFNMAILKFQHASEKSMKIVWNATFDAHPTDIISMSPGGAQGSQQQHPSDGPDGGRESADHTLGKTNTK